MTSPMELISLTIPAQAGSQTREDDDLIRCSIKKGWCGRT
jgi:hypothetical protein